MFDEKLIQGVKWWANLFGKFKFLKQYVPITKQLVIREFARQLHHDAIHSIRAVSPALSAEDWDKAASHALEFCNNSCKIIRYLTDIGIEELHCCLKSLQPCDCTEEGEDIVSTLSRSIPYDERPLRSDSDDHRVSENTVWCALLGRNDGFHGWHQAKCFVCNNLPQHAAIFKCTRKKWPGLYKSTMVFPINYMSDQDTRECQISGFLAFDSPHTDAFGGLPDIFDYRDNLATYHTLLRKSAIFNTGAILADTLSIAFRPFCDRI